MGGGGARRLYNSGQRRTSHPPLFFLYIGAKYRLAAWVKNGSISSSTQSSTGRRDVGGDGQRNGCGVAADFFFKRIFEPSQLISSTFFSIPPFPH